MGFTHISLLLSFALLLHIIKSCAQFKIISDAFPRCDIFLVKTKLNSDEEALTAEWTH